MISKNELRFGNKVQPDKEHSAQFNNIRIWSVTQIYEGGFTVDYHWPGKWFEGIPLTPEILEQIGFKSAYAAFHDGRFIYNLKTDPMTHFQWDSDHVGIIVSRADSDEGILCHCQFLHQLQNLFFALTGTELTINLEKVKV